MCSRVVAVFCALGIAASGLWADVSPQLAPPKPGPNSLASQKKAAAGKEQEPQAITIHDQLTNADPFDVVREGCHHKVHMYRMIPGRTYIIRMHSKDMDSYLRLEDSKGKRLAEDDDGDGFPNAKIVFTPTQADNYRIIATTFGNGMAGNYTIMVTPSGGNLNLKKPLLSINAMLTSSDGFDKVRQGSYAKTYQVQLQAGKTYRINMTSSQIDSYLRLEDGQGGKLAEDDDSGGNLNARIVFRATRTGTYRLIATTAANAQMGSFNLIVTEQ